MKLRHPIVVKLVGLVVYAWAKLWLRTVDLRIAAYEPSVEPHRRDCTQRNIYLFWHESIMAPLNLGGDCNLTMLTSRHGDADLLCRLALHLGYNTVRGSSGKGGDQALRELISKSSKQHLAVTPDGPRGPRRKLAVGSIFLASQTGLPLVIYAVGYDRPWRANSWDRFAIPKPFSRARIVIGPRIYIPPNLDRAGIKYYRKRVQDLLNHLTQEAEAWAASDTRRTGEHVAKPQPAPMGPNVDAIVAKVTCGNLLPLPKKRPAPTPVPMRSMDPDEKPSRRAA